jgi:hypothetical protein
MHVHNFNPTVAPNPSCCTDPTVMCPKCTAEALADNTIANVKKPEPLPELVWNWDEWSGQRITQQVVPPQQQVRNDKPGPLPEVVWNWDEIARAAGFRSVDIATSGN